MRANCRVACGLVRRPSSCFGGRVALTEIYLRGVGSCRDLLRRNGHGQCTPPPCVDSDAEQVGSLATEIYLTFPSFHDHDKEPTVKLPEP
jgi:hypothetical protein